MESAPTGRLRPDSGRKSVALALTVLGVALAGTGEALAPSVQRGLTIPLYALGIAFFAIGARNGTDTGTLADSIEADESKITRPNRLKRAVLAIGLVLSLALCSFGVIELSRSLIDPKGGLLWLASVTVLILTAFSVRSLGAYSPRWSPDVLPHSDAGRKLFWIALGCIMTVAVLARFLFLDRVPLGINPDEGDRAALAIALARGQVQRSIFDSGWYFISNMYFTLMAQFFKLTAVGFVQARAFTGLAGIVATATIAVIGTRNFGWRVGLIATGLYASMGVALQFSRETSEAGQTAALWAISLACLLEASKRGSPLMWVLAGVTGSFSVYFYPTGRLWAVAAGVASLYLLAHGLGKKRVTTLRGAFLSAIAALIVASPFLVNIARKPTEFWLRAQETSIFISNNATRLPYYDKKWDMLRLLEEQAVRTFGIVNVFADRNGFWPTDQPLFPGLLAMLALVGAGWCALSWRDPRAMLLSIWFLAGLSGSIVTVETPNLQRITTAIPLYSLFAALTLDGFLRLWRQTFAYGVPVARVAGRAGGWLIALVVFGLMVKELRYYFVDYAAMDRYVFGTAEGNTVKAQGTDTLTMTVGRFFFFINSGWVRLLAPDTPRAGLKAPGSDLPLAIAPEQNQAFMLYTRQPFYLPYLQEVVPGGVTITTTHPTEGDLLIVYRVSQQQLTRLQGAMVTLPGGATASVPGLGDTPRGWNTFPADLAWRAGLRVPSYGTYAFRIGPGPARLVIGGTEVLNLAANAGIVSSTVTLARGDQTILFESKLMTADGPALFEWSEVQSGRGLVWRRPLTQELFSTQTQNEGLLGTVTRDGKPDQLRIDRAIASCCVSEQIGASGQRYTVTWSGLLTAPLSGAYTMSLQSEGEASLLIDGTHIVTSNRPEPLSHASMYLSAGSHRVDLTFQGAGSGAIEWVWTQPGGQSSIVPPSVLRPAFNGVLTPSLPSHAVDSSFREPSPLAILP